MGNRFTPQITQKQPQSQDEYNDAKNPTDEVYKYWFKDIQTQHKNWEMRCKLFRHIIEKKI